MYELNLEETHKDIHKVPSKALQMNVFKHGIESCVALRRNCEIRASTSQIADWAGYPIESKRAKF